MLKKINAFFRRLLDSSPRPTPGGTALLQQARRQWQMGDWDFLARLDEGTIRRHAEREKLALLAAAGHLQTGGYAAAEKFIRLAKEWGASKTLISQVLIAGVHNNLGRAAALAGRGRDALQHFEEAIAIATPGSNRVVHAQGRASEQLRQLGMVPPSDWTSAITDASQDTEPQRTLMGPVTEATDPAPVNTESTR